MKEKTKKRKIWSVLSTILYVVLLAFLLFALLANVNKKPNEISGIFGYAFAVVQSGSMLDAGFEVGEVVLIHTCNTDTLKKDDIIVFYSYKDSADSAVLSNLTNITAETSNGTYVDFKLDDSELNRHTKTDAVNAGSMLIFHRIIDVYVDNFGTRFFATKGDSNAGADTIYIREDFVCAEYVNSSPFVESLLQFITSPIGLTVVILLPILFTIVLQMFSFSNEIKSARLAEKLLRRQIRYSEVDTKKHKLDEMLSDAEKIYLYDISLKEDKPNLAIILWEDGVNEALTAYQEDRDKYYEIFRKTLSKSQNKKLDFLKIKADIIFANPEISEEDVDSQAKLIYKELKEKQDAAGKTGADGAEN